MSYCTEQDLIDRFGESEIVELTDRQRTGLQDSSVIDKAIADAAARIDASVGRRYRVPLTTVPEVINGVACDIARYLLHDEQAPEQVATRYRAAIELLNRIADGRAVLPDAEAAGEGKLEIEISAPTRTFSMTTLEDF